MKGLELNRMFFAQIRPELQASFPGLYGRLAAGLVGNGSECFGYDDEYSRDHDWGLSLQLWLLPEDAGQIPVLQAWLDEAEARRTDLPRPHRTAYCADHGVTTVDAFYRSLTGCPAGPQTIYEWDRIPQENLAMAVNGEVFCDGPGVFTGVRERLLAFYPEDYRLKKMAARCAGIAQTGQYNHERSLKRGEPVTAELVLARFLNEVNGLAFLLNKVYMPYYKWQFRRLRELPLLGAELAEREARLVAERDGHGRSAQMEEICDLLARELRREGLSDAEDSFLLPHAEQIQAHIRDGQLRGLPLQYG